MRAKRTGNFMRGLAIFDRRRAGGKYLKRTIEEHGMQRILARAGRNGFRQRRRGRRIVPSQPHSSRIGRNSSP